MKIVYKFNKKFRTYGVRLDVQIRFEFLDVKQFKHEIVKFTLALSHNLEMALIQNITPTMRFMKILADCRIFCVQQHVEKGDGLCSIAQITYKMINNALLIDNWWFDFFKLGI